MMPRPTAPDLATGPLEVFCGSGPETGAVEVLTAGAGVAQGLPFPAPVFDRQAAEIGPSGTGSDTAVGTGSTVPTTVDLFGLGSVKQGLVWRPVKFTRNPDYPKVVAEGCHFKRDSAGFALRRKTSFK